MKIIGGKFKNRNIYMPVDIRPTQNLTRKALFDILGQDLEGITFLDLFAGSGAVGLEAVSRGAKRVVFVEKTPKSLEAIMENVELLGLPMLARDGLDYQVIEEDAFATIKMLGRKKERFDIVFLDPPYGLGLSKKALNVISRYDILQPTSWVIIEHELGEKLPREEGLLVLNKQKFYGKTGLSFYTFKPEF